jgi:hypothetical protein
MLLRTSSTRTANLPTRSNRSPYAKFALQLFSRVVYSNRQYVINSSSSRQLFLGGEAGSVRSRVDETATQQCVWTEGKKRK